MTDKFNENLKKARQNAKYSVLRGIYCRQRGSNPHKVGVYTYVYEDYAKYHSKPTKKERSISPAHMKNVCMQ